MRYEKDGTTYTEREVRELHPHISFAASTYDELGYTEHTPAPYVPTVTDQIVVLEMQVTPRRYREAILGTDNGWLANIEAQIAGLRAQIAA